MYVVYLAGGIASGKSTAAGLFEGHGAARIDLDVFSREVLRPGAPVLAEIARAFGADLVDPRTGELDRGLLARRAFATSEDTMRLESLELPAIGELLERHLADLADAPDAPRACIVEVPLLDRVLKTPSLAALADEVVAVTCPLAERRVRAIGRGMDAADFDRRVAQQPSEDYLRMHADVVFDNADGAEPLASQVDAWWRGHEAAGWHRMRPDKQQNVHGAAIAPATGTSVPERSQAGGLHG